MLLLSMSQFLSAVSRCSATIRGWWPPHGAAELMFIWHKSLLLQVGNIGVYLAWLCPKVYNNPSERKGSLREWVPRNCCDPRSLILRERQGWSLMPARGGDFTVLSWGSDFSGIRKTTPWPGPCGPYSLIKHKPGVKSYMVAGPLHFSLFQMFLTTVNTNPCLLFS